MLTEGIHVVVFGVMTLCSDVVGIPTFRKVVLPPWPSKTLVSLLRHYTVCNSEDHDMNFHRREYLTSCGKRVCLIN
jgi:hypothetical protein